MSLSIASFVYDLAGIFVAGSLARLLITPAAKLSSTVDDVEFRILKTYSPGIAGILGLFVIGTNHPVVGIPTTIAVGVLVPILIGLYRAATRAPELFKQWETKCDDASQKILTGIESGSYQQQVQPKLKEAKLQIQSFVAKLRSSEPESAGEETQTEPTVVALAEQASADTTQFSSADGDGVKTKPNLSKPVRKNLGKVEQS